MRGEMTGTNDALGGASGGMSESGNSKLRFGIPQVGRRYQRRPNPSARSLSQGLGPATQQRCRTIHGTTCPQQIGAGIVRNIKVARFSGEIILFCFRDSFEFCFRVFSCEQQIVKQMEIRIVTRRRKRVCDLYRMFAGAKDTRTEPIHFRSHFSKSASDLFPAPHRWQVLPARNQNPTRFQWARSGAQDLLTCILCISGRLEDG